MSSSNPGDGKEIRSELERRFFWHECGKTQSYSMPLAKCLNPSCSERFCYQCIRRYQIDSFIKADFKHMLENPKQCPVWLKNCRCRNWDFDGNDDSNPDTPRGRKKSLRIREARKTAKGQMYFEQIKRKNLKKQTGKAKPTSRRRRSSAAMSKYYLLSSVCIKII